MSEGNPVPLSHDIQGSSEIKGILKNVQEVTINGAFARNFSFRRSLRGEPPTTVDVDTHNGRDDYGDKGYESVGLGGDTAGLVDAVAGRVLHTRSGLPPSLASETQLLVIDTMQPNEYNPYGGKAKDYAVAAYTFEQKAVDFANRPLSAVGVRALLPQGQTDQLLTALERNPDAIEDFYQGVAGGLEDGGVIKRVKSDRLAVIDLRGISDRDRKTIMEGQTYSSSDVTGILAALELQGRIPRLQYKTDTHGSIDPKDARGQIAQVTDQERTPHVDVATGKARYEEAMATFKQGQGQSKPGGGLLRRVFGRRN